MFTRKNINNDQWGARRLMIVIHMVSLLLAAFSMTANAERYLVQFKSAQTFKNIVQNMKSVDAMGGTPGMKLLGAEATIGQAFEHLDMLVIDSQDTAAVASLKKHPAISLVEKEVFHPAPKPMATWGNQIQAKHVSSSRMETPWGIGAVKAPEAWTTTKGETARVMVLDTGLDRNHLAIASRFEKGHNFTTSDVNDISDTIGHGTHVSGTILADGANGGLTGVAPGAKLLMGKVCAEMGCSSIAIAAGINWAIDEQVDVINMSLGGLFISSAEEQALLRAEQSGVLVVAASGNGGTPSVSYPAAYATVLAVGAVDSSLKKADFSQWGPELAVVGPGVDVISSVPSGTGRGATLMIDLQDGKGLSEVKSMPFVGSPVASLTSNQLVFAGLGRPEDFASLDVHGKFALISRGEIAFKDKVANAIQAGAVGAVIFNNVPGLIQGSLSEDGTEVAIPVAMIEQTVGGAAVELLSAGGAVTASMSVDAIDYSSFQGTSMATPHVAGVAALVRAANKALTPAQVRELLKNTATPLGPNANNEYGHGLVNAEAAVNQAVQSLGFKLAN